MSYIPSSDDGRIAGYLYHFDNLYGNDHIAEVVFGVNFEKATIHSIFFRSPIDFENFCKFPESLMCFTNASLIDRLHHEIRDLHLSSVRGAIIEKVGSVTDNLGNKHEDRMSYYTASIRRKADKL